MSKARISARSLLLTAFVVLALLAGTIFSLYVNSAVRTLDPALRRALLYAFLSCLVTFALAGVLLYGWLVRPLTRLRAELREPSTEGRSFTLAEVDDLSTAVGALVRDLTAQKQRSDQERSELANLLEFGTEGLLHINQSGRVAHVNDAASQLLGLPPNARGQSVASLVRQAELRDLLLTAATGQPQDAREIDVDDRQLLVLCRPLPGAGGAVAAIMNLTEVRRLEAVRRDFVANVSHELKTPLTSIRGYAETLLGDDLPPELRTQFLEIIQKNAARIQRIVDDLLDLSRLQSGGWRPEIQEVDPVELAEDVWSACHAAAQKKIAFDVAANGVTGVAADPGGLRQVFSNLFDNAIRYTPAGGAVHVRIREVRNGKRGGGTSGWIEIQVQDTGSGIPRDALPRIFERFYRVDPARSRADGGTGLGLSIVKHLMERMEGEVTAESELGKGTTIKIKLPAA
jgi:two-component system phosphate regulon sensor histidine kinase PhoR